MPGRRRRPAGRGPDDRRAAQAARLRDRAVRQEPPRRPERVPADRARLRRVLRQPLPPQRRGGARARRTTRRPRTSRTSASASGRAASCTPGRPTRTTPTEEPRCGRVGKQRIEDTGPLTKKRMETIDDEVARARARLHRPPARGGDAVLRLVQHHPHALPHAPEARERRPGRAAGSRRYHDTMIDHDKHRRRAARQARRARHRRGHDRHLQHRQRAAHEHVAGRRDDAVPQREEHELGRRLPRPGADPLARQDPGRRRLERDRPAPRLAADVPRRGRRAGHRREAEGGPHDRRQDLQGPHRRLQPAAVPDRRGRQEPAAGVRLLLRRRRRARAALRQLEDRVHGAARARGRCRSGPSRSSRCGCRSSSTCAPTRTSAPTSRRTPTGTGCSTTSTSSWPRTAIVAQFLETFVEFPPRQKAASFTHRPGGGEARGGARPRATERRSSAARRRPRAWPWIPAATFRMGSDDALPGGGARAAASRSTAFWIDRYAGHQRRVRRVRRGDRLRDGRRAAARPGRLPGRARREPRARLARVHADTPGPVDLRHLNQWWTWTPGACWRHPEGPGSHARRPRRPPGRPRRLRGRRGVRRLGRQGAADRGRVGARRARRPRRRGLRLGRRARAPGERLANYWHGDFPWRAEPGYGDDRAGRLVTRPTATACHDMAGNVWEWTTRLVRRRPSGDADDAVLRAAQPARRRARGELRPGPAAVPRSRAR